MANLNDVYKKEEKKWVSRAILDETLIMPLCGSEKDMQYIYSISNGAGSKIWELLDGSRRVIEIQEMIKSGYRGKSGIIERNIVEFIKDLAKAKLITKVSGKSRDSKRKSRIATKQKSSNKKIYKKPEIAKIKIQPEQAVLSCCTINETRKTAGDRNICYNPDPTPTCWVGGYCGSSGWWDIPNRWSPVS